MGVSVATIGLPAASVITISTGTVGVGVGSTELVGTTVAVPTASVEMGMCSAEVGAWVGVIFLIFSYRVTPAYVANPMMTVDKTVNVTFIASVIGRSAACAA